jgi:phage tail-like protein
VSTEARHSSYAKYLPGVLWPAGANTGGFSIDSILLVAEKILTGIDDDVPVRHEGAGSPAHTHDDLAAVIDRLHLLFDPYRAPPRFLPWLASWLGMQLPASWEEPQQRRAIARTGPALGLRGLHEGVARCLDHYDVTTARPRITLDDGSRILFSTPTPGRLAPVHTLLSYGPFLRTRDEAAYPGLVDPGCIAVTPDGHLLLGDDGIAAGTTVAAGVWRVSRTGGYVDVEHAPPRPRPLGPPPVPGTPALDRPRALVVEQRADSWRAYVLDRQALYRLDSADLHTLTRLATRADLGLAVGSTAMVLDGPGRLMVVDQGQLVEIDAATIPAQVVRRTSPRTAEIVPGPLVGVGPHLVVADIRPQETSEEAGGLRPADLVLVDRSNPSVWTEHRLLEGLADGANPLVTPVALALDGPETLFVLDLGLRPVNGDSGDPSYKAVAEPAGVYRVQLRHPTGAGRIAATGIERVTTPGRLVQPNGMAVVDGTLYLSDPGQPVGPADNPLVRNMPGYVAVQVHFSRRRATGLPTRTRKTIAHEIASIVDLHKPATSVAAPPQVPTEREVEHSHD